jgi:hypothetical protein
VLWLHQLTYTLTLFSFHNNCLLWCDTKCYDMWTPTIWKNVPLTFQPWRWKIFVHSKCWQPSSRLDLHIATFQNTAALDLYKQILFLTLTIIIS